MGTLKWGKCLVLKCISFIVKNSVLPAEAKREERNDCFSYIKLTLVTLFFPSSRNEFTLRHSHVLVRSPLFTKGLQCVFQLAQVKGLICGMPVGHEAHWLTKYQILDLGTPLWFSELPETMYAPVVGLKPKDNFSL